MDGSSSPSYKSHDSSKHFQFKTVSFANRVQPEQALSPPLRPTPLPFIITQNGKTSSEDSSLIRRTVMQDFVSREKNQTKRHHQELRSIRSQGKGNQHISSQIASGSRVSWPIILQNKAEVFEGDALVEDGSPTSFDEDVESDLASFRDAHSNSPSLLGPLGAGRIDPFDSYPTQYKNNLVTSQLLDHCNCPFLTVIWSSTLRSRRSMAYQGDDLWFLFRPLTTGCIHQSSEVFKARYALYCSVINAASF